jgi:hypothetical protein
LLKLLTREEFKGRYGSKDKDLKILVYWAILYIHSWLSSKYDMNVQVSVA